MDRHCGEWFLLDLEFASAECPLHQLRWGTTMMMIGGNMYTLTGIHVDALGYTISVSNGRGTTLSIGNSCQYPNPSITSVFPNDVCSEF